MFVNVPTWRLKQRGDTIVEVMIVLAVLGLALGISYRTATRSLLATRQAQEDSIATELLQSQVERLYSLAPNAISLPNHIFGATAPAQFCVDTSNNVNTSVNTTLPPCFQESLYHITIINCDIDIANSLCAGHTAPPDDTFVLTAVWSDVTGQGNDTVTLTYRLHPPL